MNVFQSGLSMPCGSGAHGYFELTESMSEYTAAHFLQASGTRTPVFVRFSTVVGSRGSTDLARDIRGFAAKFYTEEGVYDLVANNTPVFFIQDAMKFPDLIHAVKPEPDSEMPQAASAHDSVMKLKEVHKAIHFLDEAYTHCKAIAADGDGVDLWGETAAGRKKAMEDKKPDKAVMQGILLNKEPSEFIKAIAQHRFWDREKVPA